MERYQVRAWNAFLATREHGRQVRKDVEDRLEAVPSGSALVLDFSGVDGITVSFGDEFLAKLVESRQSGECPDSRIVIEGTNDDVRDTLEMALARRKMAVPQCGRRAGRPR